MSSPELVKENVKHLSPSSLSTWDECRRKWGKQYAEGRSGVSIARGNTLGSFVHSILEGVYALPPKQRNIDDNLKAVAKREFEKLTGGIEWEVINPDGDQDYAREFKLDAWDSVLNALELEDPEDVEVAEIEIQLGGKINGVPFKGFVDRLDKDGSRHVVNDYKNGKVPTFPEAKRKAARQLVLYAANLIENKGYDIRLARFIYTAHNKIVPVRISDRLVKKTGENLAEAWEAMHSEVDYEPSTSPLCAFCPFVLECPEGKAVALARLKSGKSVGESTRMLLESGA